MISEAVAAVIADGEEYSAMGLSPDLTPAESADLQEAIHYALRFNDRGKPIGVRARDDAAYMAKRLLAHLERAEFAVMKRPPIKPHSVG